MARTVGRRFAIALGGSLAVVAILALAPWPVPSGSGATCTPTPARGFSSSYTFTMAACGSVVPLSAHSVRPYEITRVSDTERVEGQYVGNLSGYGSFDAYLLNSTEYSRLMNNPPTAPLPSSGYFYHCGTVPECNLSVLIPGSPITYFIFLVNYGNLSVTIEWTQTLTLFYVPH